MSYYKSNFTLSKSTYIKGVQCEKYLYLNKYKPQLKTPHSNETLQRFATSRTFEASFRDGFPDAINISEELGKDIYTQGVDYTKSLLIQNNKITLFEACLLHNEVLVMTDILIKNNDATYTIYEIKNNTETKEVFLWDIALQYYICKAVLKNIQSFNLVLNDGSNGYNVINLTDTLESKVPEVKENILRFKQVLQSKEMPNVIVDEHCLYPYKCEFLEYCKQQLF